MLKENSAIYVYFTADAVQVTLVSLCLGICVFDYLRTQKQKKIANDKEISINIRLKCGIHGSNCCKNVTPRVVRITCIPS